MNWLTGIFRHGKAPRWRDRGGKLFFRPALESLEDRHLLSFTPGNGIVIPHVNVEAVYYGQDWSRAGTQDNIAQLDTFLSTLTRSSFLGMLGEYGVGLGSWTGHAIVADSSAPIGTLNIPIWYGWDQFATIQAPTNVWVPDDQIQNMLTSQFRNGQLPAPDASRLYMVVLPEGAWLGGGEMGGYHSSFAYTTWTVRWTASGLRLVPHTTTVAYAVISHNHMDLTPFEQQTLIVSHELAEAVTDPTGQGWRDYSHVPSTAWWEIGDGDVDGVWDRFDGYVVQEIWLNSMDRAFLPQSDAAAQYGTDPLASGQFREYSWNARNYFEATVGFTTYREWEIGSGDYSGWFPVFTYIPQYVDGPNDSWDWELTVPDFGDGLPADLCVVQVETSLLPIDADPVPYATAITSTTDAVELGTYTDLVIPFNPIQIGAFDLLI